MCDITNKPDSVIPGERKGLNGERVGIKISTSMIAQYMDDVSFALLGVHLFLLATSNVVQIRT